MRHGRVGKKLGRKASHRRAMMRNLVTSLLREERVRTTLAKAKAARPVAERLITRARGGTLWDRRLVARDIRDEGVLRKLFGELGPRFADRPGGYTRVLRLGFRDGDGAPTAMLELLGAPPIKEKVKKEDKKDKGKGKGAAEPEAEEHEPREKKAEKKKPEKRPEKKAEAKPEKKKAKKGEAKAEKEGKGKPSPEKPAPKKGRTAEEKGEKAKPRRKLGFGRARQGKKPSK